jgi:hypothetical protein
VAAIPATLRIAILALLAACGVGSGGGQIISKGAMVSVAYGDARYLIPAIYVYAGGSPQPDVAFTYPDFRPLSGSTDRCGVWFKNRPPPPCARFFVSLQHGTDVRVDARPLQPILDIGPDFRGAPSARIKGNRVFLNFRTPNGVGFCLLNEPSHRYPELGLCWDHLHLSTGDFANFDFDYRYRARLPAFEAGIDRLMADFAVRRSNTVR